jgi:hypothetical protein
MTRCRTLAAAALLTVSALATGCGAAPPESPASGVDELLVPTPSPDPDDFVTRVDNPWLPLTPGSAWTRTVATDDGPRTEVTRVLDETRLVSGVEATQVVTTVTDGTDDEGERMEWFAQDRDGNVWALGERGVWQATVAGAEAGLAMPARPRRGDGFVRWAVDGEAGEVVRVGERDTSATVPAGRFTDLLALEWSDPGAGTEDEVYVAEGVGEVLRLAPDGSRVSELVEHDPAG